MLKGYTFINKVAKTMLSCCQAVRICQGFPGLALPSMFSYMNTTSHVLCWIKQYEHNMMVNYPITA